MSLVVYGESLFLQLRSIDREGEGKWGPIRAAEKNALPLRGDCKGIHLAAAE